MIYFKEARKLVTSSEGLLIVRLKYSNNKEYSNRGTNRMKCQSSSEDWKTYKHFNFFEIRRLNSISKQSIHF